MSEPVSQFKGEDENAGMASPAMDLIAAGFLLALSVFVMVESAALPVPGRIFTAPGLLPFLTAASLGLMAVILGVIAWRRRGQPVEATGDDLSTGKVMQVIACVFVYVAGIDLLSFETAVRIGHLYWVVGSFELVSVIVLTVLLWLFWKVALWKCLTVSLVWIFILSAVFRLIFKIPLPG